MGNISHTNFGVKKTDTNILEEAQRFVLNLFNQKHDTRLIFHNYQYTTQVVKTVETLAQANNYLEVIAETAQLAAWFSHCGLLFDYQNSIKSSLDLLQQFLRVQNYPADKYKLIRDALVTVQDNQVPKTQVAHLLSDALHAIQYGDQFFERSPLLRLETELLTKQQFSRAQWTHYQLQRLLNTRFFTPYAKVVYEPIVAQNILTQKTLLDKEQKNELQSSETGPRKFQNLERKIPNSATQTFFRTNYRNHINLSAIADGKANIMITVNTLLISVIISVITYKNITETNPMVLMPVVIFLITGLCSLIFAVLSARPKVTSLNQEGAVPETAKKNIVFFGNFVPLGLEKYEEAMDAMLRDGELLYGNMTRDLFYLGKVLDKKYRYLTISYNIFMIGFVTTVLLFLIVLFV